MVDHNTRAETLRRYQGIISATQDHISLVDRNFTYALVNDAYLKAHRKDRDQIVGKTVCELLGAEIFNKYVREQLERCLNGETIHYEQWFNFATGPKYMAVAYFPYIGLDGEITGVLVSARDITRRLRVEETLKQSEERLRLALDAATMGIWEWDIDRDLINWSKGVFSIYGLEESESVGSLESWLQKTHIDDRAMSRKAVKGALDNEGTPYQLEYRIQLPDRTTRWLLATGQVIRRSDGSPEKMLGTVMDITEKKNLEARLAQSQRLQSVGRLAGGIAHDFNNVLTAILGYASLVTQTLQPDQPNFRRMNELMQAGERAAEMVHQLLAFARQQVIEPRVCNLNTVLHSSHQILRPLIGAEVSLQTSYDDDLWLIRIDPVQFEQVIINLVVNARDAMPAGGQISIATRNRVLQRPISAEHEWIQGGDYVTLTVKDDGIGIPDDVRRHIFEPFFTTKNEGGSGLGLAVSYGVVKQAGGYIVLHSDPGRGTTFEIFLPAVRDAAEEPDKPGAESKETIGAERILVVEDEELVLKVTIQSLFRHGYDVISARDGKSALAQAAANNGEIQLLITDVVMPDIRGPELARQIRAIRPDIRVLYISGCVDGEVVDPETGAFLAKPFSDLTLTAKVRELLDAR